jgi:hypothetical protein
MPCPLVTVGFRQGLLLQCFLCIVTFFPHRDPVDATPRIRGGHSMRFEVSDSHYNRLAGVSTLHLLVPRDELEYAMCQVYSMMVGASRPLQENSARQIP